MSEEEASGGTHDAELELQWLVLEHKARELVREWEYQLKMRELENREKERCKDESRNEGELTSIKEFKEKPLQLQLRLKEMEAT